MLEDSNLVYGFVATIGKELDNKISSLLDEKNVYLAYIYDSIGSVAIEIYVDKICNDIKTRTNYYFYLMSFKFIIAISYGVSKVLIIRFIV